MQKEAPFVVIDILMIDINRSLENISINMDILGTIFNFLSVLSRFWTNFMMK